MTDDELRKQIIQELREQREKRNIFGSIPEYLIEIQMRQRREQHRRQHDTRNTGNTTEGHNHLHGS